MTTQKEIILEYYIDKELEEDFKTLQQNLSSLNKVIGKQHGLEGKPHSMEGYKVEVLNSIGHPITELMEKTFQRIQPSTTMALAQTARKKGQDEIKLLSIKQNEYERKFLECKESKTPVQSKAIRVFKQYISILVAVLYGFIELPITYTLLMTASLPLSLAVSVSVLFGFLSSGSIYLSAHYISKSKDEGLFFKRFIGISIIAALVAAGLGVWRASLSSEIATANANLLGGTISASSATSPLFYTVLTTLGFIITLGIELKLLKGKNELKKQFEIDAKQDEAKDYLAQINALEKQKKAIEKEIDELSVAALRRCEYGRSFEYRLVALAHELVSVYESENLKFRLDNSCPSFFGSPTWFFTMRCTEFFNNQKM